MKRFQLILTLLSEDGKEIMLYERVESNEALEMLGKFQLTIVRMMEKLRDEAIQKERSRYVDDIPF